jgi:ribosomal protein S6
MINEDSTQKNEVSKVYEIGYLLLPTLNEDGVLVEVSKIKDILEKNKGMFLSEGVSEMRNLTYAMTKPISGKNQKFETAYFGWIKFEADSDSLVEIKEELDRLENLLRYLLIKTVKEDTFVATNNNKKSKPAKFSFDKKEKEEKPEEEVKEDKKELDETIDELVIE